MRENNLYCDMHIHTNCSDGQYNIKDIISMARSNFVDAISITDHDTIQAYKNIKLEEIKDIKIVPGVEISVGSKMMMHILGYYIKTDSELVYEMEMIKRINKRKYINFIKNNKEIKKEDFIRMTPKKCIELIKKDGGVAVLAHPIRLIKKGIDLKAVLKKLVMYGLDGIESVHTEQSDKDRQQIEMIAKEYGLICTGGSDFHGSNKMFSKLGYDKQKNRIQYKYYENIKNIYIKRLEM